MKGVTFVTGVSCSGKSTVYDTIRAGSWPIQCYDVDQDGTPVDGVGALNWLAWRNEDLLYQAANYSSETGESAVVTGILWPHKIIDSTAMDAIDPEVEIRFVLLEINKTILRERLKARLAPTGKPVGPFVDFNWGLQRLLRRQVANQRNGHVLPAYRWSPGVVVEAVLARAL